MDITALREQLPALVRGHVPSNARKFSWNVINGEPTCNAIGFVIDPKPFSGKVIAVTDDAIIVKVSRTSFSVLDLKLATVVPRVGAHVYVQPYARRRFDGERADTPREEIMRNPDGSTYAVKTVILGRAPAPLPAPELKCPELRELVEQLEKLPAPDGIRCITHMLVDAGARDFEWTDPEPDKIITAPPAISFAVSSEKFDGRVSIIYNRGSDYYEIALHRGDECAQRFVDIAFTEIGQCIYDAIDDGQWRRIRIHLTM